MSFKGDIRLGDTLDFKFTTRRFSSGAPFTLAGSPVLSAYVDNGTTELTAGITLTVDFDSRTGLNHVRIVASGGNGYAAGTNVDVVITTGTVDSVSVVGEVVGSFSIEKRSALMPTTAGRTLDVSAGGEAGVDWANVGSPTTALALTGTTIASTQKVDVETIKTQAVTAAAGVTFPTSIASPTNITAGTITTATNVTTVNGLAAAVITAASIAADAITAAKIADGAIDANTFAASAITAAAIGNDAITAAKIADGAIDANTFAAGAINAAAIASDAITAAKIADGAIDSGTFAAGAIDAAAIAPNAIGASELATDAVSEIAAGVRTELATELARIDAAITTRASQTSVDTIDDFVDTEVAAIKAKTDNLPSDPADASDIAAAFATVNSTLGTIAGYVDTEVAAIKSVTDKLDDTLEDQGGGVYGFTAAALQEAPTGGSAPTAVEIADEVQTRTIAAVTTVNGLAANTVNASAVAADAVAEIQSGLATASALATVAGYVDTEVAAIKSVTDKLDSAVELDGLVYRFTTNALEQAPTGGSAPTAVEIADEVQTRTIAAVTTVNGLAANTVNASALAADAVAEIQSGLATASALATVAGYVDTEVAAIKAKTDNLPSDPADASDVAGAFSTVNSTLATIAGYLDTEIAAIKAKTDNLPADPADASDIAALFATVNSTLATIAGYVDTEVAAIKAKTDALPADPADASDIAALFATVNATLATLAGYIDTEVAAIKAKTDNLPASPAATGDAMALTVGERGAVADKLLTRHTAGGSDVSGTNARNVTNALRNGRNRTEIVGGVLTVYAEDDSTLAWSAPVTQAAGDPIVAIDPV